MSHLSPAAVTDVARALSHFVRYAPDLDENSTIAHGVLALPLCDGTIQHCQRRWANAGLARSILERVCQLRCWNDPGFCIIHDTPDRAVWCGIDGYFTLRTRPGRTLRPGPYYTLTVTVDVPRRSLSIGPVSRPSDPDRLLRPADARDPVLRSLAAHLAPRIARLPGGGTRLGKAPVLAPLFAMAASVHVVMFATRRRSGSTAYYREDVLAACLDALDLGTHRHTAERVLLRDHPEHLHVDAWTADAAAELDDRVAPPELRRGLGLYAHDKQGRLVSVGRGRRGTFYPRVLFSLAGPEPR